MRKKSVLTLFALAALPLAAQAQSQISHVQYVTLSADDTFSLQFPKYDGNLGRLAGVRIDVQANASGVLSVENLDKSNQTVAAQAFYGAAVHNDSEVLLFTPGEFNRIQRLDAYDGMTDFDGASGEMMAFEGPMPSMSLELMAESDDMRPFISEGKKQAMFELTAQAVASFELHGLNEHAAEVDVEIDLTVTVTYLIALRNIDNGVEDFAFYDLSPHYPSAPRGAQGPFVKPAGPVASPMPRTDPYTRA
jgi:hypothetical protein